MVMKDCLLRVALYRELMGVLFLVWLSEQIQIISFVRKQRHHMRRQRLGE